MKPIGSKLINQQTGSVYSLVGYDMNGSVYFRVHVDKEGDSINVFGRIRFTPHNPENNTEEFYKRYYGNFKCNVRDGYASMGFMLGRSDCPEFNSQYVKERVLVEALTHTVSTLLGGLCVSFDTIQSLLDPYIKKTTVDNKPCGSSYNELISSLSSNGKLH